jgi:uncharacterized protein (TIGR00730 family)
MTKDKSSICIFCGSSSGCNPVYGETAAAFGKTVAERGYRLVFGGGGNGLMGAAAKAAHAAGGEIVGIMPGYLKRYELSPDCRHDLVLTADMTERKRRLMAAADAFAVLPGGVGTMDEFFEVVALAGLGQLPKPIVLIDANGYFQPLVALMAHMEREGFIRPDSLSCYRLAATAEEAMEEIERGLGAYALAPSRISL